MSMHEEQLKNQHSAGQEGFEREDMSPAGVFYFMVGLAIVAILIHFIVTGMYRHLDRYDSKHQAPMNPMAVKTGVDPRTMTFHQAEGQMQATFPQPVLEDNERQQFSALVEKQDEILASYDWVDQKNGVVRIPIDKAMDLLAQRGLPVREPGAAPAAAASKNESKAKLPKKAAGN
jgi:hypothetical protein